MTLWPVLSQKTYPGVGDFDECWMMASIWAAEASDVCLRNQRPTVKAWRAVAGDPDDGYRDGGTVTEIMRGIARYYPTAKAHRLETRYWETFRAHLVNGHFISLAVDSGYLPSALRYGFLRNHQVGVWRSPKTGYIYLMNPLAPAGSRPQRISMDALKRAAMNLEGAPGWVLSVCFTPIPVHLRYGGRRTKPFPDRTRAVSSAGYVRTAPRGGTGYRVRRLVANELFVAYQVTDSGDEYRGSTRWYGNHRGDRWVHAARLTYKGGTT